MYLRLDNFVLWRRFLTFRYLFSIFFLNRSDNYLYTATLNEFFMLWGVRKKVSIPLKAPEAPLFEYIN